MKKATTSVNRRLLVVTPYFVAHGGGIESVAWQLIRHLKTQNPTLGLTWMASDCDAPPQMQGVRFVGAKSWNGLEERTGIPLPVWSLGACFRLWRAIERSDAVHFHDISYMCSVLTALFCQLQRKPYLVTQHTGFVDYPNRWMKSLRAWVNRVPGCWMLKRAHDAIFISDEVRREFSPFLPDQKLHLIPNGVDTSIFKDEGEEERVSKRGALCEQLGFDAERPLVLFVGRFVERKGISIVVELSRRFSRCNWIFAGAGVLDPEQELQENGRVMRGRKGESLAELYRAADLLVLPSYGEGFPLVVQEALACGTPVLVERALGEAAPNARAWMNMEKLELNSTDNSRWASKLQEVLDEQEAQERGEAQGNQRQGRAQWAQAEWNWKRCAQLHLDLLGLMAKRKP